MIPTSRGIQLLKLVPDELRQPELTAKWELRLSQIAEGAGNVEDFLSDIVKNAKTLVLQVKMDTRTVKFDDPQESNEHGHYSERIFSSHKTKRRRRSVKGYSRGYSDQKKDTTSIGDLLESVIKKK